jgi:hypothetical protein
MRNTGTLVILAILALGVGAAAFSVWYHYRTAERARSFWGSTTAVLIAQAPEIRALRLEAIETPQLDGEPIEQGPPDDPAIEFASAYWKILDDHDASHARGVGNVRTAMVQDVSFAWAGRRPDEPDWQYALEFNDGKNWATVLFDFDSRQAALAGDRKTVRLDPAASDTWKNFFAEQFSAAPADSPPGDKPDDAPPADSNEKPAEDSNKPAEDGVELPDKSTVPDPSL